MTTPGTGRQEADAVEEDRAGREPSGQDGVLDRLRQAQEELEEERRKADESRDMFLRARADFENLRKRVDREISHRVRRDKSGLLLGILDVVDNFDRALDQAGQENAAIIEGLRLIRRQIDTVLSAEGVSQIQAKGSPFDPVFHEAVEVIESPEAKTEIVEEEIRKGYMYEDTVLRPTRVRVKRPVSKAADDGEK